ncbi:hypothetical protein LTR02_014009 [Friedmanniomyces endolithicus]|nr:hypothetical protein LTR94_005744 [Friedmanniomyces endolithicus]KAK0809362.1 hypothetical protein LTR59_002606 [Friedmanniomyces endolithicus]KAK0819696.1 hypothetical protein LTR38_000449 [Friedmanniomyces endolithicus]KAK0822066.1 hypothetical protein LTR75_000201 [Friedmanniomyces endolithicus]KAK0858267.1 hypothetical protein LTR03_000276 [Friedmanniomyces endolithicus]
MPALAVAPSPSPAEGLAPILMPEEPMLTPTPSAAANDAETSTVADPVKPRTVLEEAPLSSKPPLAPKLGLGVTVATIQPFKMLPPLLQVFVPDATALEALKVAEVQIGMKFAFRHSVCVTRAAVFADRLISPAFEGT